MIWNETGRKSHSVYLNDNNYSKEFQIGFLRGLFDSDGYVSPKKIMFGTSSQPLARNASKFLRNLNIIHRYSVYKEKRPNRVDMHHITLLKKSHGKFFKLIQPRELKNMRRPGFEVPDLRKSNLPDRRLGRPKSFIAAKQ